MRTKVLFACNLIAGLVLYWWRQLFFLYKVIIKYLTPSLNLEPSHFPEYNANDQNPLFSLICVRFGTCEVSAFEASLRQGAVRKDRKLALLGEIWKGAKLLWLMEPLEFQSLAQNILPLSLFANVPGRFLVCFRSLYFNRGFTQVNHLIKSNTAPPGEYSTKFYIGRIRPEVRPLTLSIQFLRSVCRMNHPAPPLKDKWSAS